MEVFKVIDAKSEAELVAKIMAGDESAEEELFHRYGRGVSLILNRTTGDHAIAADLCQETFRITILKIRHGGINEPEKLPAFIWSVAHNLATDYFRKFPRGKHADLSEAQQLSDPTPNQLDTLLQKEKTGIIRRVINDLKSDRDREVLYRFYIAEEDKKRICSDLGLTNQQFNLVLFRARQHYKELYEKLADKP